LNPRPTVYETVALSRSVHESRLPLSYSGVKVSTNHHAIYSFSPSARPSFLSSVTECINALRRKDAPWTVSLLLELGVPQGRLSQRSTGGENAFEALMAEVRKKSLSAYIKVTLSKDGERSEGLMGFVHGEPSLALYVFQPSGKKERWFLGKQAAEFLFEDSANPQALLFLHEEASLKKVEESLPKARLISHDLPHFIPTAENLGRGFEEARGKKSTAAEIQEELDRKKVDEQVQGVYDLILKYHRLTAEGSAPINCPQCGGALDLLGNCPRCSQSKDSISSQHLDPRFTFDSFVVGGCNRFAQAAAKAVASNPGTSFNPLLLVGGTGLGKTHLLQAIGHKAQELHPELRVLYLSTEVLESKLSNQDSAEEMRAVCLSAGLFLLDDIQFLAGKERVQEELLRIVSIKVERGGQVVMTSDRPPKAIPSLNERLLSRLESGLIVDIQPPEEDVSLEVLHRRAQSQSLTMPEEVLSFITKACPENIRQLEGGFNRIVAFSSLMHQDISVGLAEEVLGTKLDRQREETKLEKGHSYLIEEERPEHCYRMLAAKMREGYGALVLSRSNPSSIKSRLGDDAQVYWLTEHESKTEDTLPPSLEKIILLMEEFLDEKKESVILLDDLQYLISNAAFDGVIRFIRTLVDQVSERPSIFLLSINPDSMRAQDRSILEREMEPVKMV